jgi:hypothetical protein
MPFSGSSGKISQSIYFVFFAGSFEKLHQSFELFPCCRGLVQAKKKTNKMIHRNEETEFFMKKADRLGFEKSILQK